MSRNFSLQNKQIFRWEMWGIIFIILFGSALHFTFELSGEWKPLGIISAVNESVWEHLKLAFWPAFCYALIEYFSMKNKGILSSNFWLAKALGTYLMPILIVFIFYTYTAFTRESILVVDLSSFVIAVVAGQFLSYYLISTSKIFSRSSELGLVMFCLGVLLFALFTFLPPHLGIFQDPVGGGYGIQSIK